MDLTGATIDRTDAKVDFYWRIPRTRIGADTFSVDGRACFIESGWYVFALFRRWVASVDASGSSTTDRSREHLNTAITVNLTAATRFAWVL